MRVQFIWGLMLALCVLSVPMDARPHREKLSHSIEKMAERLDLSKSQVDQIKEINERYEGIHESAKSSTKPLMEEVKRLSEEDAPNYTQIRQALERMAPYRIEMHVNRIKHKNEIKSVLTPEQREKFKESREKKREKYRKKR